MTAFYLDKAWLIVSEMFAREMATQFLAEKQRKQVGVYGAIVLGTWPRS
ncbi:MAG: hypothetical protein GY822_01130 [Deltaproteobacteria bacterium]|nr:hypothetical protein [Deltaproteobacteria bacterium]